MKKYLPLAITLLLLLAVSTVAELRTGDMYSKLNVAISSGGGVDLKSDNYQMRMVIGQPVVDTVIGDKSGTLCFGAVCTGMFDPDYKVALQGTLTYEGPEEEKMPLKNADIKIIIDYEDYRYEQGGMTDSEGGFDVEVTDLPEFLIDKNFKVEVHSLGEYGAYYECTYHPEDDGKCCTEFDQETEKCKN